MFTIRAQAIRGLAPDALEMGAACHTQAVLMNACQRQTFVRTQPAVGQLRAGSPKFEAIYPTIIKLP